MDLTAQQRDRIRRLLEVELRRAVRAAAARPCDVAALVADRRRALAALRPDLAHDPQHPADDTGESGGIGEQR